MKIHEYQAKDIFRQFQVPCPDGIMADSLDSAIEAADKLLTKHPRIFVKAQIHAGGRGKGGGVRGAGNHSEAESAIRSILGMKLVTRQTGSDGQTVRKLLIEDGSKKIDKEFYVGIILDREKERPVMMASAEGGMEIEEVAAKNPAAIIKEYIHPLAGISPFQARNLALKLGFQGNQLKSATRIFLNLYRLYCTFPVSQLEINPLVTTSDGAILALDAKINFDDSALPKFPDLGQLRDLNEESPLEVRASEYGLNYIKLDGNIGCMVNGAGLAMATMDIIKYYGASPANFLDIGGGASEEAITEAFKILIADSDVQAVLINIFGGIVRCDRVAKGIIAAARNVNVKVPMVIRLTGTNSQEGNRLLRESALAIETAGNMKDATKSIIARLPGGRK